MLNGKDPNRFGESDDPFRHHSDIFDPLMVLDEKTEIHQSHSGDLKSHLDESCGGTCRSALPSLEPHC